MVDQVVNEWIDQWIDAGQVEWISQFAQPVPQTVMANILGWPTEDLKLLKYYGDGTVKPFVYGSKHNNILPAEETKTQFEVLDEFRQYTADLIKEKRKNPTEDMISFLTEVEYSPLKRKLHDLEINGIVYAMIIGGFWDEIKADRSKLRAFTEEGMRLRSPTQGLSTRITSQDEVFQGVKVPKGSYLHLRWAAANIDPQEWDQPLDLKLDRKAGTRHLTFSQGARVCPGASLSRLEQMSTWKAIFDRIDGFEYAENNTFQHQPGIMLGTLELNLNFKKT